MKKYKFIAPAYATLGVCVYLGRVNRNVRMRAKRAGLRIVDAKKFHKMHLDMMAIERIDCQGYWHDTVKYR
jgi:hypothetical protein